MPLLPRIRLWSCFWVDCEGEKSVFPLKIDVCFAGPFTGPVGRPPSWGVASGLVLATQRFVLATQKQRPT